MEGNHYQWLHSRESTDLQFIKYASFLRQTIEKTPHLLGGWPSLSLILPKSQQKVVVENKYGEKLVGLLHETGSPEVVILCHGFRCTKEDNLIMNLAVALQNEGISALYFDFAGNGESEGSFEFGNYWREADDLRAVIQHFCGANCVISAILGHSKGAGVVLLYASKYHDIHAVVNVSARYYMKGGIEDCLGKDCMQRIKENGFIDVKNKTGSVEYRVTEESMMDRINTDMHEACLQIDKECRVLTVHGSADKIIPVEDALEFAKIIPNHQLHIIEGANQGYTSHQAELASAVLTFELHKVCTAAAKGYFWPGAWWNLPMI